VLGVVLNIL
jgi:hypothetical protein